MYIYTKIQKNVCVNVMTYVCQCMPTGLYQRPAVCMSVYACTHVKEPLLPFVRVGVTPDNIVSIFSQ